MDKQKTANQLEIILSILKAEYRQVSEALALTDNERLKAQIQIQEAIENAQEEFNKLFNSN